MPKKRVQRIPSNNDQKENNLFKNRKRKATSPLEALAASKISQSSWNMDKEQTRVILQDITGMDFLSQNTESSLDSCGTLPETTPAVYCNENSQSSSASFHLQPVPGAPRILLNCQRDNITSGSDDSSENSLSADLTPMLKPVHIQPPQTNKIRLEVNRVIKRPKTDCIAFDHYSVLSDEMILSIFSWLPKFSLAKCARVCKRWSTLVLDESLWKRIDLSTRTLCPGVLGHVLNRGVWALRLAKTEIEGPIYTGITSPIKCTRLSKLVYLDLSMAGVSTDVLEEIFCICKDLKKLSLENVQLNDKICSYIGENKDMEVLNLAMCEGITANGLIPILSNCTRLESLNIAWTNLHRHSVVYLCLCLPPNLKKLNLSGCRENISNDEVLQLCKTCPNLQELDLSDSTALTDEAVGHIISHLCRLEYLALSRCYHIAPSAIPEFNHMRSLLALDVFGILRESALELLRTNMPKIEINQFPFSSVARPTHGIRRTSIWGVRVRDIVV